MTTIANENQKLGTVGPCTVQRRWTQNCMANVESIAIQLRAKLLGHLNQHDYTILGNQNFRKKKLFEIGSTKTFHLTP